MKKLTEMQRAFVAAFMGVARGNATKAAIIAGCPKKSAHVTASRWLRIAKVQRALVARQDKADKAAIADANELDAKLTSILRSPSTHPFVAIRAVSELNKCNGRHSATVNVKGRLTLEQLLTESHGKD